MILNGKVDAKLIDTKKAKITKAGIHALQEVQNDLNEDIEEKSEE